MDSSFHVADESAPRSVWQAIKRGVFGHCPNCGQGRMFRAYLKVNESCPQCGEELHHQRADDAPPYVTIVIVGHVVLGLLLFTEDYWPDLPMLLHMLVWPALATILSLWLLPMVKGGFVGLQWALRMHGFGEADHHAAPSLGL